MPSSVQVNDIDGEEADETVKFALDGVQYEIDLSTGRPDPARRKLVLPTARSVGIDIDGDRAFRIVGDEQPATTPEILSSTPSSGSTPTLCEIASSQVRALFGRRIRFQ